MRVAKAERRFGGDDDLVAPHCLYRPAEYPFGAVSRCGVEEIDPQLQRLMDNGDRIDLGPALRQSQLAEPAAAEPGDADPHPCPSERHIFHQSPATRYLAESRNNAKPTPMHNGRSRPAGHDAPSLIPNPATPAKAGAHGKNGSRSSPEKRGGDLELHQLDESVHQITIDEDFTGNRPNALPRRPVPHPGEVLRD